MNFFCESCFRVSWNDSESGVVFFGVNRDWKFDLNWSDRISRWDSCHIKFQIDIPIFREQIDCSVLLIELFKSFSCFGDLELVKLDKLNCLIFLFGDEFSLLDNVLVIWQKLVQAISRLFRNFLLFLFNLNLDWFCWFYSLLSLLDSLFLTHFIKNKVVVD